MSLIQAILLGLIQGLTEFIPVSSSGHLIIGARLFGLEEENTFSFDVLLHFGTLIALVIFFRHDLWEFARHAGRQKKLILAIVAATVPAVIAGVLLHDAVEGSARSVELVIVTLALVGLAMVLVDRLPVKKALDKISPRDAWVIGFMQVLALIPGVSRSGSTILAGRLQGFDYKSATRFSFLLAIPVTFGACLKVLFSESGWEWIAGNTGAVIAGNIAAGVSGFIAISLMLKVVQRIGLKWFGVYRIAVAALLLLLLVTNFVE